MTIKMTLADGSIIEGSAEDIAKLQQLTGGEQEEAIAKTFDKPAQVGDTILITDASHTGGRYKNGDKLTVEMVDKDGDVWRSKEIEHRKLIVGDEFVIVGRNPGQEEEILEKGDVVRVDIEEGKSPEYGWASVVNGDVGEIRETYGDHVILRFAKNRLWKALKSEVKKVNKADSPFAKAGRRLGEYRDGDIVRVVDSPGASPRGTLIEIGGEGGRSLTYWGNDGYLYNTDCIEPVAFAEDRVDQHE